MKLKKTKEEADIFWQIASPLIDSNSPGSYFWIGITKSNEWRTVDDEPLVDSNFPNAYWAESNYFSGENTIMGKNQVSGLEIFQCIWFFYSYLTNAKNENWCLHFELKAYLRIKWYISPQVLENTIQLCV